MNEPDGSPEQKKVALVSRAAWLYGIGAVGYLLALGAGVWVGRDYLDTGGLAAAIPGVRAILAEVAG